MTDRGQKYEGGLAEAPQGNSRYRNFNALQQGVTQQISIVYVTGEVEVANPGVDVSLSYAIPQGGNPTILLLRIEFYQRPGTWPQVMTWKPVSFVRLGVQAPSYGEADIVSGEVLMQRVKVQHL